VLLILAAWLYVLALLTLLGAMTVCMVASVTSGTGRPRPFFLPWLGLSMVSLVAACWSLFGSVGLSCHALLLMLALAGLTRRAVRDEVAGATRALRSVPRLAWLMILWLGLMIGYAATDGPVYNLDPGRYHFQNLLWAKSYAVVPGLANLHARNAFASSWYAIHALFDQGPYEDRSYHVLNSLLFLLVTAFGVVGGWRALQGRSPHLSHVSGVVVLAFLASYYDLFRWLYLSCLTPDLPVNLFVVISMWLALDLRDPGWRDSSMRGLVLLAVIVSQAFAIRQSGAYLGALVALAAFGLFRERRRLDLLVVPLAMGFLLAVPTLARSYVLSGWPLFPSTSLGFLTPDWQFPRAGAEDLMRDGVRRFAFLEHVSEGGLSAPRPDMPLDEAFFVWLRHQLSSGGFVYWLLAGLALSAVTRAKTTAWRGSGWLGDPVVTAAILAAVGWTVTSPHFRYGFGYVCIAFAAPATLAASAFLTGTAGRWARGSVLLVLMGTLLNVTVKSMGVSLRGAGASYPLRVLDRLADEALGPLSGLPPTTHRAHMVGGQPIHVVDWDGGYVRFGRFPREAVLPFPEPTTDAAGRMLPGFGAAHNATIATMIWATPLPAAGAIPPGLQMRGSTLQEGFRLGGMGHTTR
jgi:hypothetical protein